MKHRRTKIRTDDNAIYHCISRTVAGEHLFGPTEKEVLRNMLWQVADFSGADVLTYCILDNHIHILIFIRGGETVDDAELIRRYRILYPKATKYQPAEVKVLEETLAAGGAEAEQLRSKLLSRMGDVSEFMKTLKQRFSVWYNAHHDRFGTLWAERFKSVLVEGSGAALETMAAYIDLNPVRAGLVADPKDYRFCGYAEAVAGNPHARAGLLRIWGAPENDKTNEAERWQYAQQSHRRLLFGKGSADGGSGGAKMDREQAKRILEKEKGRLSKAAILRCRIRYFADGAILGSAAFVDQFLDQWQKEKNRKRRPKSTPMKGANWDGLSVIERVKGEIFP